jgi:hypothetical protein
MGEGGRWVWQADKPPRAPSRGGFAQQRGRGAGQQYQGRQAVPQHQGRSQVLPQIQMSSMQNNQKGFLAGPQQGRQ